MDKSVFKLGAGKLCSSCGVKNEFSVVKGRLVFKNGDIVNIVDEALEIGGVIYNPGCVCCEEFVHRKYQIQLSLAEIYLILSGSIKLER